jgi:hypothetical protein
LPVSLDCALFLFCFSPSYVPYLPVSLDCVFFCFVSLRLVYPMLLVSPDCAVFLLCSSPSCLPYVSRYSGLCFVFVLFFSVLSTLCCQFLWIVLCFCFVSLRLFYPMLPVSLDCVVFLLCFSPSCLSYVTSFSVILFFWIFPLVFSNVYCSLYDQPIKY